VARIPDAEIERLKAEVAVERLAEARGVVVHPHGWDLTGLCPFHDDREPTLVISPAKNEEQEENRPPPDRTLRRPRPLTSPATPTDLPCGQINNLHTDAPT